MFTDFFMTSIKLQLFYSLGITLLVYALASSGQDLHYLVVFNDSSVKTDINTMTQKIQSNFTSQTKFGIIDMAALVLYSGNMFLDLILNFFTAIPSMFSIIVNGILGLIPLEVNLKSTILTYIYGVVSVIYIISVVLFLLSFRNRTAGVV
jgi:hypothetical protein